jgi:hypothetical protein
MVTPTVPSKVQNCVGAGFAFLGVLPARDDVNQIVDTKYRAVVAQRRQSVAIAIFPPARLRASNDGRIPLKARTDLRYFASK